MTPGEQNSVKEASPSLKPSGVPRPQRRDWWRPAALLAALVILLVTAKVFGIGERLGELRDWIQGLGRWGPVVFFFLYVIAVVAAIPGAALTVAAGALFGSVLGVILVINAATVGASLAFLMARYLARDAIARRLSANPKFQWLDRLTADHGAVIVALTRLVPLFPFNLLNYGFGLTRVPFWTYALWSWLCMMPGTILYVVGADAFATGLTQGEIPWPLVAALAVVGVLLTALVRHARHRLREKEIGAKAE
jgi:uncharacterized membrane protein YdjX (TVP38/TMEM64 family)